MRALDVADDVADLGHLLRGALLVEDGQLGAQLGGELLVELDAAGVGRDDDEVGEAEVVEVLREHEQRGHVVDRVAEEALDLAGVEVHREHAVGAGGLDHAGHQARGDRLARRRLLVLAAVAEPRRDGDDAVRARPHRRVDHEQQLHERVVGAQAALGVGAGRLDDEDVRAADRLVVAAVDLAVGERLQRDGAEVDAELVGDPRCQLGVGAPREQHQPLVVVDREARGHGRLHLDAHDDAQSTRGSRRRVRRLALLLLLALDVALDVGLALAGDPEGAGRHVLGDGGVRRR